MNCPRCGFNGILPIHRYCPNCSYNVVQRPPFQTFGPVVQPYNAFSGAPFGMQPGSQAYILWEENQQREQELQGMRLEERRIRQQHYLDVLNGIEPPVGYHFDGQGNLVKDYQPGEDSYTG